MLEDAILLLLAKSPTDQYSLYRQIGHTSMSQLLKAISALQQRKIIQVAKYRKSKRTGLEVPIYCLSESSWTSNNSSTKSKAKRLDIHNLVAGITSERLVEYDFVSRNLLSPKKQADILEIGSAGSRLAEAVNEFGRRKLQTFRIDIAQFGCDIRMDARMIGFRDEAFDQVICISTIEHVGIGNNGDESGDVKTVKEVLRVLKKGGNAIITVPYGKVNKPTHRVYNRHTLSRLIAVDKGSSVAKKEFYCYDSGKWKRCSQSAADRFTAEDKPAPLHFHSATCACLLVSKR
jgi:ubiquinone/menaquinone biosynthesis C-methylase UbiE